MKWAYVYRLVLTSRSLGVVGRFDAIASTWNEAKAIGQQWAEEQFLVDVTVDGTLRTQKGDKYKVAVK